MYISTSDWKNYIDKLSKLNKSAADAIVAYVQKNGFGDTDSLIRYANAVVQKYGAGSAALSAAMYDATAEAAGYFYDPAEPAPLPEYGDVAKTVHGTLKRSQNVNELAGAVSRLVKKAGADTTLQNVYRDSKKYGKKKNTGAQFAWVPMGDTCSFCLMLASAGWRNQTIGGKNHAEHIHSNCDCNYAVRFDNHSGVQGYDPDEYKEMYDNAEGDTWNEKVNSMRRAQYAKDKDRINAQKRANYAERNRKEFTNSKNDATINVDIRNVFTGGHRNEEELSLEEIKKAEDAARKQGYNGNMEYSPHVNTGIAGFPTENGERRSEDSLLMIGTDAYPSKNPESANDGLSLDSCMAHEIVGHHEAWLKHTDQSNKVLEEAQASLRASLFGVGLTDEERTMLRQDAMDRLNKAGIKFEDVKDQLDIKER